MKYCFLGFLVFICISVSGQGIITLQDKPFIYEKPIDSIIWKAISKNKLFSTLSREEQMMFYWTNLFRRNPPKFYADIIKEFVRQFPEANKPELKSLEKDIQKLSWPLPYLFLDTGLNLMAKTHSLDLASRKGVISHKSTSGKDFVQRIKEAGSYKCGAENIYSGNRNPLEALVTLLIDYGVPDKGHRVNLSDPKFELMGISFSGVTSKKAVLVQAFACK